MTGARPGTVFLTDAGQSPEQVEQWLHTAGVAGSCDWVYLSDDYLRLKVWSAGIGDGFCYVSISDGLARAAQELKGAYLDWIASLGREHPGPSWWASRLSERNTAVSETFADVCRLTVLRSLAGCAGQRSILVVVRNPALLRLLEEADWLPPRRRFRGRWWARPHRWLREGAQTWSALLAARALVFLTARTLQLLASAVQSLPMHRVPPQESGNDANVLLHTFLNDGCLGADGAFRDAYFPGLEAALQAAGYRTYILPVMFQMERGVRSAWSWASQSRSRFINPFRYYRVADYVHALGVAGSSLVLACRPVRFGGMDLTRIVRREAVRSAFSGLYHILYLRLPRRLQERGLRFRAVYAEFENMIPEKMLVLGFRGHQPQAELIGFQHGALYPNLLCNFTPVSERGIAPLPDRVICNGPIFRDILVDEGLPAERAVLGAALRYRGLWDSLGRVRAQPATATCEVFAPLPLMLDHGAELLDKLIHAFGGHPEIRVLLKAHPMSTVEQLLSASSLPGLPPNFATTTQPTAAILPTVRVMAALSTSTMFEAVAAGVPVIRVGREAALDLDPLAYLGDFSPLVRNAEALLAHVVRLLQLEDAALQDLAARGRRLLQQAFLPCDPEGLAAFLPVKPPARPFAAAES